MSEQSARRPKESTDTPQSERRTRGSNSPELLPDAGLGERQSIDSPAIGGGGANLPSTSRGGLPSSRPSAPDSGGETRRLDTQRDGDDAGLVWQGVPFSDRAIDILMAPLADHEIECKPDGMLYVEHASVRRRLLMAFGPGAWRLIPVGQPMSDAKEVVQKYQLQCPGGWTSDTTGHAAFIKNNPDYSYGDALETAKSNALVRSCKDLGIGLELWNRAFREPWMAEHCVFFWHKNRNGKNVKMWRRKDQTPFYWEQGLNLTVAPKPNPVANMPEGMSPAEYKRRNDYGDVEVRASLSKEEHFALPEYEDEEAARVAAEDALFSSDSRGD